LRQVSLAISRPLLLTREPLKLLLKKLLLLFYLTPFFEDR
jgi:hypothetical protein